MKEKIDLGNKSDLRNITAYLVDIAVWQITSVHAIHYCYEKVTFVREN